MSKEAFYLHLCEQFHGLIEDNYLLKTYVIPPGLVDDIRRAVEDDVPAYWLQDEPANAADTARLYSAWEDRECTIPEYMEHIGQQNIRIAELERQIQEPPQPSHINWRLAIDQAMTDIERDGSESALAALPWLADWLIIEAKSGMKDD